MSKRSRGQIALEQIRSKTGPASSMVPHSPELKKKGEVLSPIKKLMESPKPINKTLKKFKILSPDRFTDSVSRLISTFKTVNNVVTSLQARRKHCAWEIVVDSYQTISNSALELDEFLLLLVIWRDSFSLRWQAKSLDQHNNPRSYELVVEIPSRSERTNETGAPQSSPSSQKAPETTSQIHAQRIGTFTDKLYAIVDKAIEDDSSDLNIRPDPSLLPIQPEIVTSRTQKVALVEQEMSPDALTEKQTHDDCLAVTLEVLRARAIARGQKADLKAELLKSQLRNEETNKLLQLLPAICDSLRSLSRRTNRTRMVKKDCVDSIAGSMHIKSQEVIACFEQIFSVVPEFFNIEPSEDGLPATVQINTSLPYKEVRGFIVDHVKEQCAV